MVAEESALDVARDGSDDDLLPRSLVVGRADDDRRALLAPVSSEKTKRTNTTVPRL